MSKTLECYERMDEIPFLNTHVFVELIYYCTYSLVERRYQRLLEDEQKSLARNKKLLEDIDRLEEQMEYFSHECKQDEEKLDHAKVDMHIVKCDKISQIFVWVIAEVRLTQLIRSD